MVRAWIQEQIVMRISGHKTKTVSDRYNIVSPDGLKAAASKVDRFHEMITRTFTNTNSRPLTGDPDHAQLIEITR